MSDQDAAFAEPMPQEKFYHIARYGCHQKTIVFLLFVIAFLFAALVETLVCGHREHNVEAINMLSGHLLPTSIWRSMQLHLILPARTLRLRAAVSQREDRRDTSEQVQMAAPCDHTLSSVLRRTAVFAPFALAAAAAEAEQRRPLAVVTGACGDIGGAAAASLALRGFDVAPCCRTEEQAIAAITSLGGAAFPIATACDLADVEGVRAWARSFMDAGGRERGVDVAVFAAGVVSAPLEPRSKQGFEQNFAINHVGHFALCEALLPALRLRRGRVVTVTSTAALDLPQDYARLEDPGFRSRRSTNPRLAYSESKAANILFSDALARRESALSSGVTSNCIHPGPVASLSVRYENPKRYEQRKALTPAQRDAQAGRLGLRTPAEGATGLVWLAAEASGETGQFYVDPSVTLADLYQGYDPPWRTVQAADRLWEFTVNALK